MVCRAGRKLLIAGSGVTHAEPGRIKGDHVVIEGDHVEYVGPVGVLERNELMGLAHALLAPTTYIEPFGAVAVEAQLCGTQAITTDWGAFTETVASPFRFTTLEEAVSAIRRAAELDPAATRAAALSRYSLEAIAPLYDDWLRRLDSLWSDGWYTRDLRPAPAAA
jgi:glycosyltransferase involved in cell wall biosynthesis